MALLPGVCGAVPSAEQLAWQRMELTMFVHFTVNTFTDREWGDGTESPAIFNPSACDPGQWARVARECGFGLVILTAKHHDGFCLWPSRYTEHSVKNSPWKGGKGNLVREFVDAVRAEGLKVGLYLSPWDRHEKSYGDSDKYNEYYCRQAGELLGEYGAISEVWLDGACAEGPNGRKQVYDWERMLGTIKTYQPGAVVFSDAGPEVRWVANEQGFAGDPCWSTVDPEVVKYPGEWSERIKQTLHHGDRGGSVWRPAETDVSIRPGWFWHEKEDAEVRPPANLIDLFFKSVGRNSLLLLNLPPDQRGLFHENDVAALRGFRKHLDEIFARNLALGKPVTASQTRHNHPLFSPAHVTDGHPETYWTTDDGITTGWVEIDLATPTRFNVICLQEQIRLGQRVARHHVQVLQEGQWTTVAEGQTIGYKRLHRIAPVTAQRVRVHIDEALACPTLLNVGLYESSLVEADALSAPTQMSAEREDVRWAGR